jgi:NADPH-dependent 2,4-dienoyl-CoA reductase/sulfur reductase-like enzyme
LYDSACLFYLKDYYPVYHKEPRQILVVGGNDAGLSAAGRAFRLDQQSLVIVFEKSNRMGYATCALPMFIAGQIPAEKLQGPSPEQIERKRGFKVLHLHEAIEIHPREHTVLVRSLVTGETTFFKYFKLILATGAQAVIPPVAQIDADNIFVLRHFNDAERIDTFIRNSQPRKALVLGAGFLGLEIAEALRLRGLDVFLVDRSPGVLHDFPDELSRILFERMASSGIHLKFGSEILGFSVQGKLINRAVLSPSNESIDVDLVFVAGGIRPDIRLAHDSDIPLGTTGAIAVNNHQQTRRPDIYAAGDCAQSLHMITGKPVWFPFAGAASRQGRVAGSHAMGLRDSFPGVLGTSMLKVFEMECGRTGLTFSEAVQAGFDPVISVISEESKPGYMTNSTPLTIALIGDRRSKRILGAQIAGKNDAGIRLNIIATAIAGHLTLNDLALMDFGYTPAINNLWDPVAVAAAVILKKLRGKNN